MGFNRSSGHVFIDLDANEMRFILHVPKGACFLHMVRHDSLG